MNYAQEDDGFATFGFAQPQKDVNSYLNPPIDDEDDDEDEEEEDDSNYNQKQNKDETYKERDQLEDLIVNSEDPVDLEQKIYEDLFQGTTDQERREQEERRKEKERNEREKIAELMSY